MRQWIRSLLSRAYSALQPKPDLASENKELRRAVNAVVSESLDRQSRAEAMERVNELVEARRMAGSGPWQTSGKVLEETDRLIGIGRESINNPQEGLALKESIYSQGVGLDIDLMLSNLGWRRETNLSWLEFSRWGIQQIILISRLYYIKNPLIQRGVNVSADYVFGRGVDVSSPDEAANDTLKEFFERNKSTLGQIGLVDLHRRKMYDGNIFFCFFSDTVDKGSVTIRTIDATEIQEITTDPNDTDKPQLYKRTWTERVFNDKDGSFKTTERQAWYPALGYVPGSKPTTINSYPVEWDHPILHRKSGAVSKWLFGCPLVYAALDWAKAARRFLEHCATVKQALAQIAMTLTTKGGQQALEGMKQQLGTTVGPPTNAWDTNPPAVNGSIFAAGPGTTLAAFNTKGAGGDPAEVREFRNMVACVFGIPPTFLGDLETANLATATSLDRPTELHFLTAQEEWREDLLTICSYVLDVSKGAPSGTFRASHSKAEIRNAKFVQRGYRKFMEAATEKTVNVIEIVCNFPALVEGDVPQQVGAIVAADGTGKLDEKTVAVQLYDQLGIEDGAEIAEQQYPGTVADRQKQKDEAAKALLQQPVVAKSTEAVRLARKLVAAVSGESNGAHRN